MSNPLLSLSAVPALWQLGSEYFDVVEAARFPLHILRFRNDELLPQLGLDPALVTNDHWVEAFGQFRGRSPFLALRYHGYQFGEYNARLGDGRGFLYGQFRSVADELIDLGTKGSGTTPYSRGGDGRLTLKGGVREVIAAEALHRQGVRTSRCLSLIETGEQLWRGDEPSPTRAAVMVRFSRSHIRFGSFERLYYLQRPDLVERLLDHVIAEYYPEIKADPERYARFYASLVERVAELAAQWMAAGFCHGVLNTDNMSISGESFDYGPYGFILSYDPNFTAAYFDHWGLYRFGHQPSICRQNLELLQRPLGLVMPQADLEAGLSPFEDHFSAAFWPRILAKLGLKPYDLPDLGDLLSLTLAWLKASQVSYSGFFAELRQRFSPDWRTDPNLILADVYATESAEIQTLFAQWQSGYQRILAQLPEAEMSEIPRRLEQHNPLVVPIRPQIEAVWDPIVAADDWEPFYRLLEQIRR